MKRLGLLALTMGAMMSKEAAEAMSDVNKTNYRLDSYRPYVGGYNFFRGMKIGGINKHFNKKRHGKMLRRKHKSK